MKHPKKRKLNQVHLNVGETHPPESHSCARIYTGL
jgi:hypothetical protein